ncbi:hypothetical protein ABZP36_030837 [Zizania latifolia]
MVSRTPLPWTGSGIGSPAKPTPSPVSKQPPSMDRSVAAAAGSSSYSPASRCSGLPASDASPPQVLLGPTVV